MPNSWLKSACRGIFRWYLSRFPLRDGKAFLYERLHASLKPEDRYAVIRLDKGFRMKLDLADPEQLKVYFYGHYHERYEADLVQRLLSGDEVFWDVGANVGYFTLVAATALANRGQIVAFEPGKNAYERLTENLVDTGNPMLVVEDPMVTLEVLAPYVVTTHIRDSALWDTPQGVWFQWVAMGDGSIDFKKFIKRYKELCPNAAMQLEVITGRPPALIKCYDQEFWKGYPKSDAAEFARFMALAKNGKPYLGPMMIGGTGKQPAPFDAALKEQQMTDLERSLTYAKSIL